MSIYLYLLTLTIPNNMLMCLLIRYIIAKLEGNNKNIDAVKHEIKSCYVEVVSYLQQHFPHDSTFLRDCRALHPDYKTKSSGLAAFGRLAYLLSNVLKNTGIYIISAGQLADEIKRQYLIYQTIDILYDPTETVNEYWNRVGAFVGTDGKCCFAELAALAKDCLCVSHGNAVPERGFSINKQILQDRSQMQEKTIVAMRFVKEALLMYDGNVSVLCIICYSIIIVCNM